MAVRKVAKKPATKKRPAGATAPAPDRKHAVKASLRNVDLTKATSALNLVLRADGEKSGNWWSAAARSSGMRATAGNASGSPGPTSRS